MVCLHPGAVTFSCVRSMNYLLSSHHSECIVASPRDSVKCLDANQWLSMITPAVDFAASPRLHLYGVCEAWRGVLPSPAPAAHRGQVKRTGQLVTNTTIHAYRYVGLMGSLFRKNMNKFAVFTMMEQ